MTGVRVVSLVLRFLALWCVLLAVQSAGVVLAMQHQHQEYPGSTPWYAVIPAVIFVAVAIVIWIFSLEIASKLYPPEQPGETFSLDALQALRVGCCLLGLWLLPSVVPALMQVIVIAYESARAGASVSFEPVINDAFYVLTRLVIAVVLLAKNRAIAGTLLGRDEN